MSNGDEKSAILNRVAAWVGDPAEAERWYETTVIPALGQTARQAVEAGQEASVHRYLDQIGAGGFA